MNETNLNSDVVVVPGAVLMYPALNPPMLHTWLQLKLLVGDQAESPPVSIPELEAYSGKSRSTLYTHLDALRRAELVRWCFAARGQLVLSLPAGLDSGNLDYSGILDQKTGLQSRKLENEPSASPENRKIEQRIHDTGPTTTIQSNKLDPQSGIESGKPDYSEKLDQESGLQSGSPDQSNNVDQLSGLESKKLDQETAIKSRKLDDKSSLRTENWIDNEVQPEISSQIRLESRNLDGNPLPSPEIWNHALSLKPLINNININQEEVLRGTRFQVTGSDSGNLEKETLRADRQTLGLRPNQAQWEAIAAEVQELARWQAALEQRQMHRWNPMNIPGILELYARDGPEGCRFCRKSNPATGLEALAITLEADARGEYG